MQVALCEISSFKNLFVFLYKNPTYMNLDFHIVIFQVRAYKSITFSSFITGSINLRVCYESSYFPTQVHSQLFPPSPFHLHNIFH